MNVCYHLMSNKGSIFANSDLGPQAAATPRCWPGFCKPTICPCGSHK
jgi:hypothetical protein